jgi:hypothetical protein
LSFPARTTQRGNPNPNRLATALLTSLQGGLLLAKTLRDGGPLETALHIVIDHIESFTTATTSRGAD